MTHWHIIRCVSGQEGRAERYLERMGYPHGWHPVEKQRLPREIYARLFNAWVGRGARKEDKPKQYKTRPYVHGYVFLPTNAIDVAEVKHNRYGAWLEVLCVGEVPYTLTDTQMLAMKEIPDRLAEMVEEAERLAREAWEARRPVVGQKAKILEGPFCGKSWVVSGHDEEKGYVDLDGGDLFGKVRLKETSVERAA